ncbi:hypothetical protein LguiB_013921 [Lonicera macranthoides]
MLQFPPTQLPHSRSTPFAIFTGLRRCCSSSSTSTFRTTICPPCLLFHSQSILPKEVEK